MATDLTTYYERLANGRKGARDATLEQLGDAQQAVREATSLLRRVAALVRSEEEARKNQRLAELSSEAKSWLAAHEEMSVGALDGAWAVYRCRDRQGRPVAPLARAEAAEQRVRELEQREREVRFAEAQRVENAIEQARALSEIEQGDAK